MTNKATRQQARALGIEAKIHGLNVESVLTDKGMQTLCKNEDARTVKALIGEFIHGWKLPITRRGDVLDSG